MLDKELLIANWRNQLIAQGSMLPENLDELEDHLRISIATLEKEGLSSEEAFLIAIKRIGTTDMLTDEFGKINNNALWIQRFSWMIIGILLFQLVGGIWKLFAEGIGWTTLIYASSPKVSSILFVLISVGLPIGILLFVRKTVKGDMTVQHRLTLFVHFIARRPIVSFCVFVFTLALIPIVSFMMRVIGANVIPVAVFGEFQYGVTLYQLAAGFSLPILGVAILFWLHQQRKLISLDSI